MSNPNLDDLRSFVDHCIMLKGSLEYVDVGTDVKLICYRWREEVKEL